jgi:hypothetical protein
MLALPSAGHFSRPDPASGIVCSLTDCHAGVQERAEYRSADARLTIGTPESA